MKVRRISELVDWTRAMHQQLAKRLAESALQHESELAKMLLSYLAEHEATLEKTILGFEQQADQKALNTWMYDFSEHEQIDLQRFCAKPFSEMTINEICGAVFDVHNQAIDLYRDLLQRADIPEAKDLLETLLGIEEHETMRLAQQTNRMGDM